MKVPEPRKLSSGKWFIQLRIKGESICITNTDRKKCIAEATAIKAGLKAAPKKEERITLSQAIDRYIDNRDKVLSPSTIRGYRTIQHARFPVLMQMDVHKITQEAVQKAVNAESVSVSAKTIRNALGLIGPALESAGIDTEKLRLKKIRVPQPIKKEKQFLDERQILQLIEASVGKDCEIPMLLAVWLGLRRSEILGLQWESVDFKAKTIKVENTLVPDETHHLVTKVQTKTASSRRTIPCPDYILHKLSLLQPEPEWRRGLIFRLHPDTLRKHINALCRSCGIPEIGIHGLRHTNATVMAMLGIADKVAMQRGGWSSDQTMRQIYQHVMDSARQRADQKIDQFFYDLIDGNGKQSC